MRTVILLGFLGVTFAVPLIPQPLLSASNSKELLMSLNNARLQSFQTPANPLIFPLPGILQPRTQTSGLSQTSWSSLGHFGGFVPNQIPFPGQVNLAQRTQAIQQEPSQLQTLQQNQQDPYQIIPCYFSYGLPQVWGQMFQYYPICMYGPQDLPPQFFPLQGGQQPQQIPSYPEFGCITQQAVSGLPGGRQQQVTVDLLRGDVPESPGMPTENVLPLPQRDNVNVRYPYGGMFMPSHISKNQQANILTSSTHTDNTIPSELIDEKINPDMLKET